MKRRLPKTKGMVNEMLNEGLIFKAFQNDDENVEFKFWDTIKSNRSFCSFEMISIALDVVFIVV